MELVNNTVKSENEIEIYKHRVFELADEFINTQLEEERRKAIYKPNGIFRAMLIYIASNTPKINNADIEKLNQLFNIYISLCVKYEKLPTLGMFAAFAKINPDTFYTWVNGENRSNIYYDSNNCIINNIATYKLTHPEGSYRAVPSTAHADSVKSWRETCKNFLVDSLHNSVGTDANKIFIAKSAYGMAETAPVQAAPQAHHRTPEQIMEDYGGAQALEGPTITPDF